MKIAASIIALLVLQCALRSSVTMACVLAFFLLAVGCFLINGTVRRITLHGDRFEVAYWLLSSKIFYWNDVREIGLTSISTPSKIGDYGVVRGLGFQFSESCIEAKTRAMEKNYRRFGYHLILTDRYDCALLSLEREFLKTWRKAKGIPEPEPENEPELLGELAESSLDSDAENERENEDSELCLLLARLGRNGREADAGAFSNCVFSSGDAEALKRTVMELEREDIALVVEKSEDENGVLLWNVSVMCESQERAASIVAETALLLEEECSTVCCPNCGNRMITDIPPDAKGDGGEVLYVEFRCRKCGLSQVHNCG